MQEVQGLNPGAAPPKFGAKTPPYPTTRSQRCVKGPSDSLPPKIGPCGMVYAEGQAPGMTKKKCRGGVKCFLNLGIAKNPAEDYRLSSPGEAPPRKGAEVAEDPGELVVFVVVGGVADLGLQQMLGYMLIFSTSPITSCTFSGTSSMTVTGAVPSLARSRDISLPII